LCLLASGFSPTEFTNFDLDELCIHNIDILPDYSSVAVSSGLSMFYHPLLVSVEQTRHAATTTPTASGGGVDIAHSQWKLGNNTGRLSNSIFKLWQRSLNNLASDKENISESDMFCKLASLKREFTLELRYSYSNKK
jgi:hypothetical protein